MHELYEINMIYLLFCKENDHISGTVTTNPGSNGTCKQHSHRKQNNIFLLPTNIVYRMMLVPFGETLV